MPGREFTAQSDGGYRFGFNGKEQDKETYGDGNAMDFGARIYDGRLGRWLSVDKEFSKGPAFSPYNAFLNNPVLLEDPDGNWVKITTTKYYKDKGQLKVKHWYNILKKTEIIHKEITVGEVRFLDVNTDYNDHLSPLTLDQKKQIISNFQTELTNAYANKKFTDLGKPTITTSISFKGDMKFVTGLTELKKGQELYVVGDLMQRGEDAVSQDFGGSLVGIHTNFALMEGTPKDAGNYFAHEFTHQRTRDFKECLFQIFVNPHLTYPENSGHYDHDQGGIFTLSPKVPDPQANYKNVESIKKGSKGIRLNRVERKLNEKGYKDLYK